MPHINPKDAAYIKNGGEPRNIGEFEYAIALLIRKFLLRNGPLPRFSDMNEVLGGLESSKLEFYRMVMGPYEASKVRENGNALGGLLDPDKFIWVNGEVRPR